MKIQQIRATFKVESESVPGTFYSVTLDPLHCDCPHFGVRMRKTGSDCKHIIAVRKFIEDRKDERKREILDEIGRQGSVPYETLAERHDVRDILSLIDDGKITVRSGMASKTFK